METAYLGEIRMFAFAATPRNYLPCDGRTLDGKRNQGLATVVSPLFNTRSPKVWDKVDVPFEIPDLRGRTPVNRGEFQEDGRTDTYRVGDRGGSETVALTMANLPPHTHRVTASEDSGTSGNMTGRYIAAVSRDDLSPPNERLLFGDAGDSSKLVTLAADSVGDAGPGVARDNIEPSRAINFCICVVGILATGLRA